jgi:hypothetical protein
MKKSSKITLVLGGHSQKEGDVGLKPPNPPKLKVKKHRFCTYYDIISFT